MSYCLVIDDVWHSIDTPSSCHRKQLYSRVLDHFSNIEEENLEEVAIARDAKWKTIEVMLVHMRTHTIMLHYSGTHLDILKEMQKSVKAWEHLE